jgi:hypothetical protein
MSGKAVDLKIALLLFCVNKSADQRSAETAYAKGKAIAILLN